MSESKNPISSDWFARGDMDVQAAEILLAQDGPLPMIAFHIQQAVEKYLKGYLLFAGWQFRRIHDLEVLIREAIDRSRDFLPYLEMCQMVTEYYIETRYPHGFSTDLQKGMLAKQLKSTRELVALCLEKVEA